MDVTVTAGTNDSQRAFRGYRTRSPADTDLPAPLKPQAESELAESGLARLCLLVVG